MKNTFKIKRNLKIKLKWLFFLLIDLLLWASLILLITFVFPNKWWVVAGFLTDLFFALALLFYLCLKKMQTGLLLAFFVVSLVVLQLFRQVNWLNLIFLSALFIALFFSNRL